MGWEGEGERRGNTVCQIKVRTRSTLRFFCFRASLSLLSLPPLVLLLPLEEEEEEDEEEDEDEEESLGERFDLKG